MLPTAAYIAPVMHIVTIRSEIGYAASSFNPVSPSEASTDPEHTAQGNESSTYEHEAWGW